MQKLSNFATNLLVIFYNFSDQFGKVDMQTVTKYLKEKHNISIPLSPVTITQDHIDYLVSINKLPDVKNFLLEIHK
jgi:citrate lyase alpha subunit